MLLVRSRTRADIEALRRLIPGIEPFEDTGADYRWRAVVPRERWQAVVATLVGEIDYGNFKNAVGDRQGLERVGVYHEVWRVLGRLQTGDDPS
jgi:hypothetical protein